MKKSILILLLALSGQAVYSSAQTDTLVVKTNVVCNTCKNTIEHNLSFEKGVKYSRVDVDKSEVMVLYRADKTNPEQIRKAITLIGYEADGMPADPKAYKRLPDCCKATEKH